MRFLAMLACAAVLGCLGVVPAHAEKRVALVIGNADYRALPRLTNPRNDAEDVGKALRDLHFETVVATDLDRNGMNQALDRFTRAVDGADIAIVYYSGHGMQFAGANYLLPVEARLDSAADVNRFRLMPLDDVLDSLKSVRGARVLVQYALYAPNPEMRWQLEQFEPDEADIAFATQFITWNSCKYGIQRVDACRLKDGSLLLMELEDYNPFLSLDRVKKSQKELFLTTLCEALQK